MTCSQYTGGLWIQARYAGPCDGCRETVECGFRAYYIPAGRRLLCQDCGTRQVNRARVAQLNKIDAAAHGHATKGRE